MCCTYSAGEDMMEPVISSSGPLSWNQALQFRWLHDGSIRKPGSRSEGKTILCSSKQQARNCPTEWAAQPNTTSTGIREAPGTFAAMCFSLSPPDGRRRPNNSLTFAKAPDPSSRRIRVRVTVWNKSRQLRESFFLRFFIYPCKAVCSMHFRTVEQLSLYNCTSFWISPSSYNRCLSSKLWSLLCNSMFCGEWKPGSLVRFRGMIEVVSGWLENCE
jgi:hypothetical protein